MSMFKIVKLTFIVEKKTVIEKISFYFRFTVN